MPGKLHPPDVVTALAVAFRKEGGRALLVGGCVRAMFTGERVKDWDVEVCYRRASRARARKQVRRETVRTREA